MDFIFNGNGVAVVFCCETERLFRIEVSLHKLLSDVQSELIERGLIEFGACGYVVKPDSRCKELEFINGENFIISEGGCFLLDWDYLKPDWSDAAPESYKLSSGATDHICKTFKKYVGAIYATKSVNRTSYNKRLGNYKTQAEEVEGFQLATGEFQAGDCFLSFQMPIEEQLERARQKEYSEETVARCQESLQWIARYA
jgi:hypothetical protein